MESDILSHQERRDVFSSSQYVTSINSLLSIESVDKTQRMRRIW